MEPGGRKLFVGAMSRFSFQFLATLRDLHCNRGYEKGMVVSARA